MFCGARPESDFLDPIYKQISTPSLHYIGQQDVMVPAARSLELAEAYESSEILYHPGNHFIPQGIGHSSKIVDFIDRMMSPNPSIDAVLNTHAAAHATTHLQKVPSFSSRTPRKVRVIKRQSSFRVQTCVRA